MDRAAPQAPAVVRLPSFGQAEAHRHAGYQVLLPLGGAVSVAVGDARPLRVTPPGACVLWPDVEHAVQAGAHDTDLLTVELALDDVAAACQRLAVSLPRPGEGALLLEQLGPLVEEPLLALAVPTEAAAFRRELVRFVAVALVERIGPGASAGALAPRRYKHVAVERAVAWMHGHPEEALTADVLARRVGTSPRNLSRRFKEELGVTPAAFLLRVRMERAAALLTSTTWGVQEVAARVGYESTSHFGRAFRSVHGCAPGVWRERGGAGSA